MKPIMCHICGMPSEAIKLKSHSVQINGTMKSRREILAHACHMEKLEIFTEVCFENLVGI
jgi:hypothetical protein